MGDGGRREQFIGGKESGKGHEGDGGHPDPRLFSTSLDTDEDIERRLRASRVENPLAQSTFGDLGLAATVEGPDRFTPMVLVQGFERAQLVGFDLASVRYFRLRPDGDALDPVWRSGINEELAFMWTQLTSPGTYVPLALPRDRLLQETLRAIARERELSLDEDDTGAVEELIAPLLEVADEELDQLRLQLTRMETQTGVPELYLRDIRLGEGAHTLPFALPGDASLSETKERLRALATKRDALPELALFDAPEDRMSFDRPVPWPVPPDSPVLRKGGSGLSDTLHPKWWEVLKPIRICSFWSKNWWMYHHDERHGGRASGCSDITSTSVNRLRLLRAVTLPGGGSVVTIPSVVDGKIYVGTYGSSNCALYRIDLATGDIEDSFAPPYAGNAYAQGIGGSPAVVDGRVYFSHMPGRVYCLDAATFNLIWMTDLRNPSQTRRQPVRNLQGDCFSSPLVVNGRVYVGSGEGEYGAFGFVFCLDAATGEVVWLWCTSQFQTGADNAPNVIPPSAAVSNPLPAWASGFQIAPNDPPPGVSVWSSFAYDSVLNRVYAGTGNATGDDPLPEGKYSEGLISLDASTGVFRGFFQPAPEDSYRDTDLDVDVPGSATIFVRDGKRVVGFGSKNGSYFLLDPDTLKVLGGGSQRRQLLPRIGGTGTPSDPGTPIDAVDDYSTAGNFPENRWGVFGTAAVNSKLGRLFVGLGGYVGIGDHTTTPFVRALDWNTLLDAWPTAVGPDDVRRYTTASPPLYTSDEAGLSSPAVVNDVVFVSTSKAALYALDAGSGLCLWKRDHASGAESLGPAIYGNYVVVGAGDNVYIYVLRPWWWDLLVNVNVPELYDRWWWLKPPEPPWPEPPWEVLRRKGIPPIGPRPGPGPDPIPDVIRDVRDVGPAVE